MEKGELCKSHHFYLDGDSFGPFIFCEIGKINDYFCQGPKQKKVLYVFMIRHYASPRAQLNGPSQERIIRIA